MRFGKLTFAALFLVAAASQVQAQSLTTTFADNNRFTGDMFDVQALHSVTINSFNVNVDTGLVPLAVYYRLGTYVGHETTAADFTLLGQATVTGAGESNPTFLPIGGLNLTAGNTYGLYVTVNSNVNAPPYMYYTTGSNTYSNADLKITTGNGEGGLFGSLGVFTPRTWNGTINYTPTAAVPEPGSVALLIGMGMVGAGFLRRRKQASKAA